MSDSATPATFMWLWAGERTFGMLVPFLGIAFGTNLLLSALNVVYD